jgi:hypothetical protein
MSDSEVYETSGEQPGERVVWALDVLTPAQLEGRACIVCDGQEGPMVPLPGRSPQLFEHERCRPRREHIRGARIASNSRAEFDAAAVAGRMARLVVRAEQLLEQATRQRRISLIWHADAEAWLRDAAAGMLSGGQEAADDVR